MTKPVWGSPLLAAQAAYLSHLGTASTAEVVEKDGIFAVTTGIDSNAENGVLSAGPAPVTDRMAREIVAWMRARCVPASWLCAEGDARSESARVLVEAGCAPEDAAWEMRAPLDSLALEREAPAGISIETVSTEGGLDAWLDVAVACDWIDTSADRRARRELRLSLGFGASAPELLYVAFRGDRAVGMASAFFGDDTVMLSAVAVLESERRRGVGTALAAVRLREARRRGCRTAVLGPSPDGAELYRPLGFSTHTVPGHRCFYLVPSAGRS